VRGEGGRVPEVMEIEGREKKARVKREEGENSSNMGSVVTDGRTCSRIHQLAVAVLRGWLGKKRRVALRGGTTSFSADFF